MNSDRAPALEAYESFAAIYDDFTHRNDYESWIGATLLPRLSGYGLEAPGAALDVGCGTGKAFPPLLERGWDICGCDISPAMVRIARERFGDRVRLSVADMRKLPTLGSFDLVLVMNDAVNHLLSEGDLQQAMTGVANNLSPSGLLVFDCNTAALFRAMFDAAARHAVERDGRQWVWKGMGECDGSASTFRAQISGDSIDPITIAERHFPRQQIEAALATADLECQAVLGQREADGSVVMSDRPDEERDEKLVYVSSHAS